ncbi:MAG: hypothetical protein WBX25_24490 [Rhodomicrobium sp.]
MFLFVIFVLGLFGDEQFYLIWPAMFLLARSVRQSAIVIFAIGLPIASVFYPILEGFSYIAMGALVASFRQVRAAIEDIATGRMICLSVLLLLVVPFAGGATFVQTALFKVQPALIAIILFRTLSGKGPFLRIVSMRFIQKIGIVSYSLYLWQQVSLAPKVWGELNTGADWFFREHAFLIAVFLVPALISYFFIEKPLIAVGHRLSQKIIDASRLRSLEALRQEKKLEMAIS